jgi:signal transduction histidine kinase/CheY-like chemotaxis protein
MSVPYDPPEEDATALRERIARLEKINQALMGRVERSMDFSGTGFSLFQTAVLLEDQVKTRTRDLATTLSDLSDAYARLKDVRDEAETAKQNLTNAIEAVSEGFALFDDHERLVLCNAPFRALMPGISSSLVPGLSFTDMAKLFSMSEHIVRPSGQSPWGWAARRIALFRKRHASFIQQFAGDRWIQVSNKKTTGGGTVIFQTDITDIVRNERVRREKELDEQSRILQATIDHLPQGICMISRDLRLRAWNNRFLELLALPLRQVVAHAGFLRVLETASAGAFPGDQEGLATFRHWLTHPTQDGLAGIDLVRADGVNLTLNATLMPDGGMVASFADVTLERRATSALQEAKETLEQRVEERTSALSKEVLERRAIEAELITARDAAEDAVKGKTRFLAAASHDLLQPLNAARLFLSLLSEADLNVRQQRLAERADSAFASVEQLLEALLDISRMDAGGVETRIGPVALAPLLARLASEFQPLADQKGLSLRVVESVLTAESDERLLRRLVQNLLSNAVRYTDAGGVLLGARRRGNSVVIEVWDTGPGIPADKLPLIFEEFRRLNAETSGTPRGMGLGLAIVDRVARLLGHDVMVKSVPGRGSRFSLRLPLAAGTPAPAEMPVPIPRHAVDLRNVTAIVIENDLGILEGMVELLSTRGVRAVPAISAGEALEAVASLGKTPDVLVADYHLDEGTGLEAIRLIRHGLGHAVPAVIVTADHSAAVERGILDEAIVLLHKPVKTSHLFTELERLVSH